MSSIGKIIIIFSTIVIVFASNINIPVDWSSLSNLNLLSSRHQHIVLGFILLLIGIISFSATRAAYKSNNNLILLQSGRNVNFSLDRTLSNLYPSIMYCLTWKVIVIYLYVAITIPIVGLLVGLYSLFKEQYEEYALPLIVINITAYTIKYFYFPFSL